MQDLKQVFRQLQAEEAKPSASLPAYPVPQLKINHDKAVWVLGEEQELGNQVSVFVVKTYAQTTVFNADGRLVLKSQIFTPRERSKALVLYSLGGQFTNTLLTEALKNINKDEFSVINAWILPVIITNTEPQKAVWEAKRSALKSLINFMREEAINSLTSYEITLKLVKQKSGVKIWAEPKVMSVKSVDHISEDILKLAYEYLTEFEQYKFKYNTTVFMSQNADDIPVEL